MLAVLLAAIMMVGMFPIPVRASGYPSTIADCDEAKEEPGLSRHAEIITTSPPAVQVNVVDVSALTELMDGASQLEENDFTPDSWETFAEAMAYAEAILKIYETQLFVSAEAFQQEINAFVHALYDAIDALVLLSSLVAPLNDGYITVFITFEGYNLGHGFYVEPTPVTIPVGATAADATIALQNANPHLGRVPNWVAFRGGMGSGFYIEGIRGFNRGFVNLPPYLQEMTSWVNAFRFNDAVEGGDLLEFDFTSTSGWMITVNNVLLPVGAGSWPVNDGDVIRWQFTVFGLGADVGISSGWGASPLFIMHDRSDLIRSLFLPNVSASARAAALAVSINPLATPEQISWAINLLLSAEEAPPSVPSSISITPGSREMFRGASHAFTAVVQNQLGQNLPDETVILSLTEGGNNPVVIHSGTTLVDGIVRIHPEQALGTILLNATSGPINNTAIITIGNPTGIARDWDVSLLTSMTAGQYSHFGVNLLPANMGATLYGHRIEWLSANEDVVSIIANANNPLTAAVAAVSIGSAQITARLINEATGAHVGNPVNVTITVRPSTTGITITTGNQYRTAVQGTTNINLNVTAYPPGANFTGYRVERTIVDTTVATLPAPGSPWNNVNATAVGAGVTTSTAQLVRISDGAPIGTPITFIITVNPLTGITRTDANANRTLVEGATLGTPVVLTPAGGGITGSEIIRWSTDPSVITPAAGTGLTNNATAHRTGTARIYAQLRNGGIDIGQPVYFDFTITPVLSTQILTDVALDAGNNSILSVAQHGAGMNANRFIRWTSSNPEVVAVQEHPAPTNLATANVTLNNEITAVSAGTAIITAQLMTGTAANRVETGTPITFVIIVDGGVMPVDRQALSDVIEQANALTEYDFTASSWALLMDALANAIIVYNDANAVQNDVDYAAELLNQAIHNLVVRPSIDRSELYAIIAEAERLMSVHFTEQTWEDVEAALVTAIFIYNNVHATQDQINTAVYHLRDAMNRLVFDVTWQTAMNRSLNHILQMVPAPQFGSVGGEWAVLALARAEHPVPYGFFETYIHQIGERLTNIGVTADPNSTQHAGGQYPLNRVFNAVTQKYEVRLGNQAQSTENSRLIAALTSLGVDASNFTHNGITFDLVAQYGQRHDATSNQMWGEIQGINGPIWNLIALNTRGWDNPYEISDRQWVGGTTASKPITLNERIQWILDVQLSNGGWVLNHFESGNANTASLPSDPDMTAMAIQALAPYRHIPAVSTAIDRAITELSRTQLLNGGWASFGDDNVQSPAQIIVALTKLGYDPMTDARFVTANGNNPVSAVLRFFDPITGGFYHPHPSDGGTVNIMATEQAAYSLVAYWRFVNNMTSLFDMSDAFPVDTPITVNRDALRVIIAQAESLREDDFTSASWNHLVNELIFATMVYNDANAAQAQINNAVGRLNTAILNLVPRESDQPGNGQPGNNQPNQPSDARVSLIVLNPNARPGDPRLFMHGGTVQQMYVYIRPGETAYSILRIPEVGLLIRSAGHHTWAGMYVEAINNFGEFDGGPLSGWMYAVNRVFPAFSASLFTLQDGDVLTWLYTYELGADLTAWGTGSMLGINREPIDAEIARAQGLNAAFFTAASWANLQAALNAAIYERNRSTATQETLNAALAALTAAMNALALLPGVPPPPPGTPGLPDNIVLPDTDFDDVVVDDALDVQEMDDIDVPYAETPRIDLPVIGQIEAWINPFADVGSDAWYFEYVRFAVTHGFMMGIANDEFAPYMDMTRAMMTTLLWRVVGAPTEILDHQFDDVADGTWYSDAIAWANMNDIVRGHGDGMFSPHDAITREQLALMLMNFAAYLGQDISSNGFINEFTDMNQISPWALDAMKWANERGLINGRTLTSLVPSGTAMRAEAAGIKYRFIHM